MTTTTSGRPTRIAAALIASAAAVTLAACGSSSSSSSANPLAPKTSAAAGSIVIGSNDFTESTLLADIYGVTLKAQGVKVTYKYNIGSREVTYGLLRNGDIQLMPEYNGALLAYLDKAATPTSVSDTDNQLTAKLAPGLELLDPSPAQDKDSLTVNAQTAAKYHLTSASTIADLAPFAGDLTIGAAPEFQTRQEGLIGLSAEYGLKFKGFKALDAGGPLTEGALKANNIQVGDIFTTDTTVTADKWVVLQDPKNLFGFQNVVPVGQKSVLTPAVVSALNAVSAKLDTATLLQLDSQVSAKGADPLPVATAWLQSVGLPS
ncbi:ABC transporter substrate-binding protein [Streptacidiphilus sp. PB12-B1b]|uniref:ABC transporter substrate-binding protein n=1 Tax=Streptacidiphilus sp. PB12-B1b TaxID=2705012 RepID=UPI0015F9818F|nr:ABC transporter substrate-binding protein [Streptacidiphilus sp. PB12-B1b]QMU79670.1 ABC transporter substrate-binding protein [Streptacidiphilus sp. PB12-B1b]